jgi:SNF2 family DNA or RNA helicase
MCWSLGSYQQFNARLHRQGQGRPVRIIHLIATGTIDERVMDVLSNKDAVQTNLLKALKSV